MRIASLRLPAVWNSLAEKYERPDEQARMDLWAWVHMNDTIHALALAVSAGRWTGHEQMFVVSKTTSSREDTMGLMAQWWPDVELRKTFRKRESLFDCLKAEMLLGWRAGL